MRVTAAGCLLVLLACLARPAAADDLFALTAEETAAAAADFQQFCAICHGADRQGHANDNAPSLRAESLFRSGYPQPLLDFVAYGRHGTPMGGYLDEVGGPLTAERLHRLLRWLLEQVDVEPLDLPLDPVEGDVQRGARIFAHECATCHGEHGEGDIGPAIGNPAMLALTTDAFLRYAIENGREGTDMPAFRDELSAADIDAVTAFLRSRAAGWSERQPALRPPPAPGDYVLNPAGGDPEFVLEDGLYLRARDLYEAVQQRRRLVILDTRVPSLWQTGHIAGAVPVPYYFEDFERLAGPLPKDGTWIVSYCQCPRAEAEFVTQKLRAIGYANTAVLWEGIQGWIAQGFPIELGSQVAPVGGKQP
jgi:mono/diheme cytochrome c family protein/rhodanese-related sulfurtransferase